jgi:hypothetical protein
MPKLFLAKLERHFYAADDIRCAKVDAGGCFNRKSSSLGVDKSSHFAGKVGILDDNSFWKISEGEFSLVLTELLFLGSPKKIQHYKPKSLIWA